MKGTSPALEYYGFFFVSDSSAGAGWHIVDFGYFMVIQKKYIA